MAATWQLWHPVLNMRHLPCDGHPGWSPRAVTQSARLHSVNRTPVNLTPSGGSGGATKQDKSSTWCRISLGWKGVIVKRKIL